MPCKPPPAPLDVDAHVFQEPWEAETVALAGLLLKQGLFTREEWRQALAFQSLVANDDRERHAPYASWVSAIESLMAAHGGVTAEALADMRDTWKQAVDATPHGEPIVLGQRGR